MNVQFYAICEDLCLCEIQKGKVIKSKLSIGGYFRVPEAILRNS